MEEETLSIYKASRTIKKRENSLYNALRSIYEDSIFVGEISQLWPDLPLIANLRCGLWYSPRFQSTCYFKSTDGHCNNWSFNTSRLNLHVAHLAGTPFFSSFSLTCFGLFAVRTRETNGKHIETDMMCFILYLLGKF